MAATPKLYKSRLIAVYKEPGKTNITFAWNKPGAYLIYEDGQLVYVGYSGYNVYRTCLRHFQRWRDKSSFLSLLGLKSAGVTYYGNDMGRYKVRIILRTPTRAEKLEKSLIQKYQPRDNKEKYPDYQQKKTDIELVSEFEHSRVTNFDDVDVPF